MKKRAQYLDDAALTFAKHGELHGVTEEQVKEGIVRKQAFVKQVVYNVFNKTAELTNEPVNIDHCEKLAGLVNDEISVADTIALGEDDFTDLVLYKTSELAIELDQQLNNSSDKK